MLVSLKETTLGLRNSILRLPFQYGTACLTHCPQAVLRAKIEVGGRAFSGFSGDCLPPSWFDKSPEKGFEQQIQEMLEAITYASQVMCEETTSSTTLFSAWLDAYHRIQHHAATRGWTDLLASFGLSMIERAMMDAMARATRQSFHQAVWSNLFEIEPGRVHSGLTGTDLQQWLPTKPATHLFVRHTVGLADPLTENDISQEQRLQDGFPQSLESYVAASGLKYFKIKVANDLERDLARLRTIAQVIETKRGADYQVTLDGNEQYKQAADFDSLVEHIRADKDLTTFWDNVLLIEQPLARDISLSAEHTHGIRALGKLKPVIIDESDGTLEAYPQALAIGYRGVSSKNCKGPIRSLLNAGLTWQMNRHLASTHYVMTGEDLCTVGIVPVQADLCLVATLGLTHIERNGHHFHCGLSYLPTSQQHAALHKHSDLYHENNGIIAPRLVNGRFEIGSLQCMGFGFDVEPDIDAMESLDEWDFASLGLS